MISIKSIVKFPADVVAGDGIVITRAGATYTFSIDPNFAIDIGNASGVLSPANGGTGVANTGTLTINGNGILSLPANAHVSLANGKTAAFNNTVSFTGTDGAPVNVGAGGTVVYVGGALGAATATSINGIVSLASIAAMAAHNAAVNGAVDVSQELGTTGATLANGTPKYTADQFNSYYFHAAATAVVTSGQVAAASFGAVLAGFDFAHRIKATTAISSPANNDAARHRQAIEGYRVAHWGWGATGAKQIVIAFQMYSTVAGTTFVRLLNNATDRSYYHEITLVAGWNFIAFFVPGETTGTWLKTTGVGLYLDIFASGKDATPQASMDAWVATANKLQTTNSVNLLGTNNNETLITGLYVDVGSVLPIAADLPNLMRPFTTEVVLCQRYWEKSYEYAIPIQTSDLAGIANDATLVAGATSTNAITVQYFTTKRATPTIATYRRDGGGTNPSFWRYNAATYAAITVQAQSSKSFQAAFFTTAAGLTAGDAVVIDGHWTADARL